VREGERGGREWKKRRRPLGGIVSVSSDGVSPLLVAALPDDVSSITRGESMDMRYLFTFTDTRSNHPLVNCSSPLRRPQISDLNNHVLVVPELLAKDCSVIVSGCEP
jgi:hypothetical protein